MRYWQVSTRRFSRASQKLEMDEAWHEFTATPLSWYRVWKKKLIQRVTFASSEEEGLLLPLVQTLEPLPDISPSTGFREEIALELADDKLLSRGILGYSLGDEKDKLLKKGLKQFRIELREEDRVLKTTVSLLTLDHPSIKESQMRQEVAKLCYQTLYRMTNFDPQEWEAALYAAKTYLEGDPSSPTASQKSSKKSKT